MDSTPGKAISNWKWGYIIMISKFLINFMGSGVAKSFGVLLPHMVERFDATYALLGFICNIPNTSMSLSGPLVLLILRRGNHRLVAMVGGVLSGVCLIVCGFVSDTATLFVVFSLTGVGRACLFMPVTILLNVYFQDNYVLMNTIASYGMTASVMFLPVIAERSLEAYGYSGVFIILGALMFHQVVGAAAIRKPIFRLKEQTDHQVQSGFDPSDSKATGREQTEEDDGDDIKGHDETSTVIDETSTMIDENNLEMESHQYEQNQCVEEIYPDGESDEEDGDAGFVNKSQEYFPLISRNEVSDKATKSKEDNSDIQCSNFTHRCKLFMTEESLFLMSLLPIFCFVYTYDVWLLFLVPHAEQLGIPQSQAVFISSIGGIGGILGRTIAVILLAKKVNMYPIYIVFGAISSLTFFFDFVGKSFVIRSFLAFIQGLSFFILDTGNSHFLKSTLVDENNFSFGLGLINFVHGVESLSSGFITGALFDMIQCYTTVFMITGLAPMFFTIITAVISVILKRRKKSS